MFSLSRAKVFAGLTNASGLAVAAFDLCVGLFVYGPSVCLNILDISRVRVVVVSVCVQRVCRKVVEDVR